MAKPFQPQSFAVDLLKFAEAAKGKLRAAVVVGTQDMFEEMVVRTPLDTGFLRNSYYAFLGDAEGEAAQIPEDARTGDKSGGVALANLNVVAAAIQLGQRLTVVNSAKYALRLELGFVGEDSLGRHYEQKGRLWIQGVLNDADMIYRKAAEQVAQGNYQGNNPGGGGALPDVGYVKP